ncbi:hypothetical protein Tco_1429131 [Tanacetum coccineum]
MEQAVEQHCLESKTFEVKMNKVLNEKERLLEQVINKDIVNIIMNSSMDNTYVNAYECEKCLKLETELLNKKDFIKKETYEKLFRSFTTLEKHCISLEVDTQLNQEIFNETTLFQIKEKDLVITTLKNELRKVKGKDLANNVVTKHTIAPEMLKIDVEPIAPRLQIIETIHVDFDELIAMASEHSSLEPALHEMTPATISSGLVPNPPPLTPADRPALDVIAPIAEVVAPEPVASTGSPSSTIVDQDAPSPSNSQTTPKTQSPVISNDVEEENHDLDVAHMNNDPFFGIPIPENDSKASSSSDVIPTILHTAAPNS